VSGKPSAFEGLLRRERRIVLAALAVLCLLAWYYIASGAQLGASAWQMSGFALFPHRIAPAAMESMPDMSDMPGMEGMDMSGLPAGQAGREVSTQLLVVAMWWLMMIAMMTPAAAPAILLYAGVYRHNLSRGAASGLAPTGAFAVGYLLAWFAFSLLAAALQWAFERSGLVSAATMGSHSRVLSAALLLAAGVYQLSPLKRACLAQCRAPATFLSRHWRPGIAGALRLGLLHGAWCVGCCWLLMVLLLVGGAMNLVWIAALTLLVIAEKLLPGGQWTGRVAGMVLLAWGVLTLLA
jgi:predicted metal-binding membrane protein